MIEVKNLSFQYREQAVFKELNFALAKGEVLSILGANGVGKTTLIKCLAKILTPSAGACRLQTSTGKEPRIAYVPQAKKLNFSYNVVEFVSFGRSALHSYLAKPTATDLCAAKQWLAKLGGTKLFSASINQISGGELQLCYIAKALVSEPDLLILDEPEANLDFKHQTQLIHLLKELAQEYQMTIIMNTHFLNHAQRLADKCLIMSKESYQFGTRDEILQEPILKKYFEANVRKCSYTENGQQQTAFIIV